jgi:hypothetical protein
MTDAIDVAREAFLLAVEPLGTVLMKQQREIVAAADRYALAAVDRVVPEDFGHYNHPEPPHSSVGAFTGPCPLCRKHVLIKEILSGQLPAIERKFGGRPCH